MLRIHVLQQWYALSDPAMEEAPCDTPVKRQLTQLVGLKDIPDETTISQLPPPSGEASVGSGNAQADHQALAAQKA